MTTRLCVTSINLFVAAYTIIFEGFSYVFQRLHRGDIQLLAKGD